MTTPTTTTTGTAVLVTSFGYGHAPAPEADLTVDARRHLRNPHHDPAMRHRTGLDADVRHHVMTTPGAAGLIHHTAAAARALADVAGAGGRQVVLAIGCVGGKHRAVALAEAVGTALRAFGICVDVAHRDVDKPVIQR
jgi:RNase adaptor protein for sRNA GlmZ degradation